MMIFNNATLAELIKELYKNNIHSVENIGISFDEPLIGVSKGNDPYYTFLKDDIGEFYWSPKEVFSQKYPIQESEILQVVSIVFPQTEQTKKANSHQQKFTSYEWAKHRLIGQQFINDFLDALIKQLNILGIEAVAPTRLTTWSNHTSDRYGYASSWSERHTAYVCGLGTFGLSDGLITEKGKAHRCASIVVKSDLKPTVKPYNHHLAYCQFIHDGSCVKCIERCPAGAITVDGHDKIACRTYQRDVLKPYLHSTFKLNSSSCGLCQTGVPCESKIPIRD